MIPIYKILLSRRSGTAPLFNFYSEDGDVYETDDLTVLESKVVELLTTIPSGDIKPIQDMTCEISVLINN